MTACFESTEPVTGNWMNRNLMGQGLKLADQQQLQDSTD